MIRMLCVVFPTLLPCAIAAVDAPKTLSLDERLLRAIALGDLGGVKETAAKVDLVRVPNLLYHALESPNADVVEFLRAKYDLKISDLHIAAIRGDGMKLRRVMPFGNSLQRARMSTRQLASHLARWLMPQNLGTSRSSPCFCRPAPKSIPPQTATPL